MKISIDRLMAVAAFITLLCLAAGPSAQETADRKVPVSPYQLLRAEPGGYDTLDDPVAGAFTPHLLRKLRARADNHFPEGAQILFVAFRSFEPGRPEALFRNARVTSVAIPRGPLQLKDSAAALQIWSGTEFQRLFDIAAPWDDIIAVAAFPMELWRPDVDFVLAQQANDNGRMISQYKHARIPRAAFPSWK